MKKMGMKTRRTSKQGFTLLELIAVAAIMILFLGTAFYGSTVAIKKYKEEIRLNKDDLDFEKDAHDDMENYAGQDIPGVCTATPSPTPTISPTPEPSPTPEIGHNNNGHNNNGHNNNGNGNSGNIIHGDSEDVTASSSVTSQAWGSGMNLYVSVPNVSPDTCSKVVVTVGFHFGNSNGKINPLNGNYGNFTGGHYANGVITLNASGGQLNNFQSSCYIGLTGENLDGTTAYIISVEVVPK